MRDMRTRFKCRVVRKPFSILEIMCWRMVWICLIAAAPAVAQVAVPVHDSDSSPRLLSVEEGRSIVNVAWQQESPEAGMRDCSHAVHQIFATAGFEYPYASSFEIYAGNENFERVKNPHTGDLIAWPGHVGIVVDPLQHSFYSLVRTGLEAQDYESAYWKSRGRPRFYRYKVESGGVVSAANTAGLVQRIPWPYTTSDRGRPSKNAPLSENASSNRPPAAASEKREVIYGPPAPPVSPVSKNAEETFEIPASVIIAAGNEPPTREEVAEGISELSDMLGSQLLNDDPLKQSAASGDRRAFQCGASGSQARPRLGAPSR